MKQRIVHMLMPAPTISHQEMRCGVRACNTQYWPPTVRSILFTYQPKLVTCSRCRKLLKR